MTMNEVAFENPETNPAELELVHNNAYDSILTRGPAKIFEKIAEPLNEHIYGPLTEKNRTLGLIAANLTLTAPRLLEPVLGDHYIDNLQNGRRVRAFGNLLGKLFLKLTDGIDGPVTRANGITSLGGAGFDAFTDMVGTYDDGKRIKQAYEHNGNLDPLTKTVINSRLGIDVAVAVVGGGINTYTAKQAEKAGVVLEERNKPKANAEAKAKYALSAAADGIMLLGTLANNPKSVERTKRIGQGILIASIVAGIVSLFKYGRSAYSNHRQTQQSLQPQYSDQIAADIYSGPGFRRKPVTRPIK